MSVTVTGGAGAIAFGSDDSLFFGKYLAALITASQAATVTYSDADAASAPAPAVGLGAVLFQDAPLLPVAVSTADVVVSIAAATPVSLSGGGAGAIVLAGNGGLVFTDITPSGLATAKIAVGDGANFIQTAGSGGGQYYVASGSGDDTVGILTGSATVSAGTGSNLVVLGGGAASGNSVVYSNGYDSIVGNVVVNGGGTDTVEIQSGQATINPGSSNFVVDDASPNPFVLLAGTGSDTINVPGSGVAQVASGTGNVSLVLTGSGRITAVASAGNVMVDAVGSSGGVSVLAGAGNDTLLAGQGPDTLAGGFGTALMVSGAGATTFRFTSGANAGTDTISGFKAGDALQLIGYGLTPGSAAAMAQQGPGSSTLLLADGTTIVVNTAARLTSAQIKTG